MVSVAKLTCRTRQAAVTLALIATAICGANYAHAAESGMAIPARPARATRLITTHDLARIRDIDSLSVSLDATRFAILVRRAEPESNSYRSAWFVGSLDGQAPLTYVGDGGAMRLLTRPNGARTGDIGGSVARWSPDGRFIAYTVMREGAVQLWTSRVDGDSQRQITRNDADVRDFAWSKDGRQLYFSVGSSRADIAARTEAAHRSGQLLQSYSYLFRAVNPGVPDQPLETQLTVWAVDSEGRYERLADESERAAFTTIQQDNFGERGSGAESHANRISAALKPPVIAPDGAIAWLEREDPRQTGSLPMARLRVAIDSKEPPITCEDPRCAGHYIRKLWWTPDAHEVIIWQRNGSTDSHASLYAWAPRNNSMRTIISTTDQQLRSCEAAGTRIVCLRETPLEPPHVATIDIKTGAVTPVGDVNPEFAGFRLGRVERLEWDTAPDRAQIGYSPRAAGFLLYPPDYDPTRHYPLFVAPYRGEGFLRGDAGDEHPLLVYAANGFIVLNSSFPHAIRANVDSDGNGVMRRMYDPARNFPHLTMLSETTFAGMDLVATRANVDSTRIGIGGVSHGAFVPLYMVQTRDRFAALSVAQGSWNETEYHFGPLSHPYGVQAQSMFPEDPAFWKPIDLSEHLDEVEAPILFNVATSELVNVARLVRRMSDARLPYEARAFHDELHLKWQPAHRLTIYDRNVDWFRFWLQDIEDPDPAKEEQYRRWRQLRELQCRNRRSLRDYCVVKSVRAEVAR